MYMGIGTGPADSAVAGPIILTPPGGQSFQLASKN